jgi:hypothetical protein
MPKKPLAETHPELAKQWHPTLNGDLTANVFTYGSDKIVWWKCPVGDDHEWEARIANRTKLNRGCPICSGKKVVLSNSLYTTNPNVAKLLCKTKNIITSKEISKGSNKKVWWKCPNGDDHEWLAPPHRVEEKSCPYCNNKIISKEKSLLSNYPKIASEWHKSKNKTLSPIDVFPNSHKKAWWKCPKGDDHEWEATISSRVKGNGCPICSGYKVVKSNCLSTLCPDIAKEWYQPKNGSITPFDVIPGSSKKVWWKCPKGDDHIYKSKIENRTRLGRACPICNGNSVTKTNNLKYFSPQIAKEWHPSKNRNLKPSMFKNGSNKKVWWKCPKGDDHEWEAIISNRTLHNHNCPVCSGLKIVSSNSLSTLNPSLASEWHFKKNYPITPNDVGIGTTSLYWWVCKKDSNHIWKTSIYNRNRKNGNGCPFCTLTPQSKQELTITFELMKFFNNIDPKGFKTRLDGRLRAIDIYIPKLNLCIEFDGSYWHKNKRELDKIKSEMLLEEGFELIRVREEPLKKIYDTDVISKQPYNGKQVTNDILSVIMNKFKLEEKLISKIIDYQSKNVLQNEKGLERYIDKILTEKAKAK